MSVQDNKSLESLRAKGCCEAVKVVPSDDCITRPDYWDCNCDEDYIHQKSCDRCDQCEAVPDEQPDSHKTEVARMLAGESGLGHCVVEDE